MVRTRATRVKPTSQDSAASKESQDSAYCSPTSEEKPKRLLTYHVKSQMAERIRKLEDIKRSLVGDIERRHDVIMMSIGPRYGNMLLIEFIKEEVVQPEQEYESFIRPKAVVSGSGAGAGPRGFVTSTVRKPREMSPPSLSPLSPVAVAAPGQRVTRQSRKRSRSLARATSEDNLSMIVAEEIPRTVKKPTRRTRSVSNNRQTQVLTKSIYSTPATKTRHLTAVTPKADPATAALKRHPRHGEFALSLTGSPLMIPQPSSEANITVPLSNGEVYSILPTDNFVAGQIPALSEDTRKQILQLRKNLDRLLKK